MTKEVRRDVFPAIRRQRLIPDKGVSIARRGQGRKIAAAALTLDERRLRDARLSAVRRERGVPAEQAAQARAAREALECGLQVLAEHARARNVIGTTARQAAQAAARIGLEFLEEHECLCDVSLAGRRPTIRFDATAARELLDLAPGAVGSLYAVALLYAFARIAGSDPGESLLRVAEAHELLSDAERAELWRALGDGTLDSGGILLRFLQESLGRPREERERLAAWLRARAMIELPYNAERVRRAIAQETDLAALRQRIYTEINETYVEDVDAANAERIADWCLEEGMQLVGGRFSRAFYVDAMLMASAKVLSTAALRPAVRHLERVAAQLADELPRSDDSGQDALTNAIGGHLQAAINLTPRDRVSLAEVEGVVGALRDALTGLENRMLAAVDGGDMRAKLRRRESATPAQLSRRRREARRKLDQVRDAVWAVERAALDAPKSDPAYVAFFQRLFPLDAINMGILNELLDPFFGEDEDIHQLIRDSGHNMYVTPNLKAWLRKCDHWVEALPAYASYEMVPRDGGYDVVTWVQRSILEDMYRRHAEDWALNIEEVMALEHVAIARKLLVAQLRLRQRVEQLATRQQMSEEEAIRQVVIEANLGDLVGALAALVEATYLNLCEEVAQARERDGASRLEALEGVIASDSSRRNVAGATLADLGRSPSRARKALAELTRPRRLQRRAQELRQLAMKRRREPPCAHVLTTLGPGETEVNIENWLQESMALFNVSRAHGVERQVKARVEDYRRRLVAVGKQLVEEMELAGELYGLLQEEGLDPDDADEVEQGVIRLLASYPEVGSETAKLALLLDYEERSGAREPAPDDAAEPRGVQEYIASHPQLEAAALQKVIAGNDLRAEVDRYAREHGVTEAQAASALVDGDAGYRAEKDNALHAEARQRVLESLGLADEVRSYLRNRLDPTLATVTARRDIITENGLAPELDDPRYRYDAAGPFKKYNLLYTPSRVDLGAHEVESVRDVPKWVGGRDPEAARAGKALYALYNTGPTAVESPRLAEFLKVGENFFTRGGVFYLSLAAGANIDALQIGDFEFCRDEWNKRGDRLVLPTGETYGGFCVPKEFTLLFAIVNAAVAPETSAQLLDGFGVPGELHDQVRGDLRALLRMQLACADALEWEMRARELLRERYEQYFSVLGKPGYVSRLSALAQTLEKAGVLSPDREQQRHQRYELAAWVNKKAHGLEEINRVGPFRKVHLIRELAQEARRKNPMVASDDKLIGVMAAGYKEGERKEGAEIRIGDVRFGAGARKLEIYAGTAEEHLLKDIDPEGREVIRRLFDGFQSPADIRIVGTCTASDIFNHVPGSGLEAVKEQALQRLLAAGLEQNVIDSNCAVYGADLERWSGVKGLPEPQQQALIADIGPKIHLVVLDRRSVYRTYEEAIQGVDFVDLGIPDPELLDLIDDLPKLIHLMRRGRPNSALIFADGTSGGRRRAFSYRYAGSKHKVQELLALDDNIVYGALGLGRDTVEAWRREMVAQRDQAQALFAALTQRRTDEARRMYQSLVRSVIRTGRAEEAAREEAQAQHFGVPAAYYRYRSRALGRVAAGLPLQELDFGTWLVLGGAYVLNGRISALEIEQRRLELEHAVPAPARGRRRRARAFTAADIDHMTGLFARPRYVPEAEEEYREVDTGIAGSLKAAEEQVVYLARREARRQEAQRAAALRLRQQAFAAAADAVSAAVARGDLEALYERAKACLGDGRSEVVVEAFGKYLAWARGAFTVLAQSLAPSEAERRRGIGGQIDGFFSGGEIDQQLCVELAEATTRAAEHAQGDKALLERVAMALELLDIASLIEGTRGAGTPREMIVQLARFLDATVNSHIFDYVPYHYHKQRGAAFECYSRQEKFELVERRHRWLYTHLRHLIATRTELRSAADEYQDAWLGDADRGLMGVGVRGENPAQQFWFSYARLRDAVVLRHDGFPWPEVFVGADPEAIGHRSRVNCVLVYPHGNTTVPVALEQAPKLAADEGLNVFLCAFPDIVQEGRNGIKLLHAHDAFGWVGRADYERLLRGAGVGESEISKRSRDVGDDGVLIAASFTEPIVAHGIFFHFTHPFRPEIGSVRAPLIQPLVWEAATHLKCRLPDMLKGSGVRTAAQFNWYHEQTAATPEDRAKAEIRGALQDFAQEHDTVIVKPEKESGGRSARILPVRDDGQLIAQNVGELTELIYDISKTDNVVVQDVLKSQVRRLYTPDFLENMVDRFARIGVPVLLDREPRTPLFSYFREIIIRGKGGYELASHITVISTRGIANVGQGGLLYEYRDEFIHPKYRDDLGRALTHAAYASMEAQRRYIGEHWREILEEYLAIHPEFADRVQMQVGEDLTGLSDTDIPYEMGDYMPVFLVDENDCLVQLFDEETEQLVPLFDEAGQPTDVRVYDEQGEPLPRVDDEGNAVPILMFDERDRRLPRVDAGGKPIPTLVAYKIEPNPGAGLWRPHNDQLPPERKGEAVYTIFRCLGEHAAEYRERLRELGVRPAARRRKRKPVARARYLAPPLAS